MFTAQHACTFNIHTHTTHTCDIIFNSSFEAALKQNLREKQQQKILLKQQYY